MTIRILAAIVNVAAYLPLKAIEAWDAADTALASFYADCGREEDQ